MNLKKNCHTKRHRALGKEEIENLPYSLFLFPLLFSIELLFKRPMLFRPKRGYYPENAFSRTFFPFFFFPG